MKKDYVLRFPSSVEILDLRVMESYLKGGVDVNLRVGGEDGPYPLAVAAGALNLDACARLLQAGARADSWKKGCGTPMAYAVRAMRDAAAENGAVRYSRLLRLADMLLEHGANPCEDDPHSALDLAVALGYRELVEMLVAHDERVAPGRRSLYRYTNDGELVAGQDADINQAMRYAYQYRNEPVMIRLLKMGAKENYFREDGLSPFQAFVAKGMDKVVAYYVMERGENLAQKDESGKTLLQIAQNASTKLLLRSLKAGSPADVIAKPVKLGIHEIGVIHGNVVMKERFEVFSI